MLQHSGARLAAAAQRGVRRFSASAAAAPARASAAAAAPASASATAPAPAPPAAAVSVLDIAYPVNMHRSDAAARSAAVPPIEVSAHVAMCDGGGGAGGHPIEFLQLDRRAGAEPSLCRYCGLRYVAAAHGHGHGHGGH